MIDRRRLRQRRLEIEEKYPLFWFADTMNEVAEIYGWSEQAMSAWREYEVLAEMLEMRLPTHGH